MSVGLTPPDYLLPVRGVQLATVASGIKTNGNSDMVLMVLDDATQSAAVFTQNAYCAAPVEIARSHMLQARCSALLINSGNANAGTGKQGEADALALCHQVAQGVGIREQQVLPFSTGVISEPLPLSRMQVGVEQLIGELSENNWLEAAEAILTTDTVTKGLSLQCTIDNQVLTLTGISKGSGMIHPDMATMLAFMATDAAVDPYSLRQLIQSVCDKTFNCISVDGDTSTNDAFVLMATGAAGNRLLSPSHPQWSVFTELVERAALHLAQSIVRDGEGATKCIEIQVGGGASVEDCRLAAFTVAHSPLVKTAFFAGDPNLGRILAAIGRSKVVDLDMQKVSLHIGYLPVLETGEPAAEYSEPQAAALMAAEDVSIYIDLGMGEESARIWTTDLSYDYVKINAEYRS